MARRERFLGGMNEAMTWQPMVALIEPHYLAAGQGTQPMPLERMPRIHFMQRWFNGLDPAMGDALHDSESMRRFAGIELVEDAFPDESTVLHFRHLLEKQHLGAAIFATVRTQLEAQGLLLKSGTIVDATILAAPSSTKNARGQRDPEMSSTRKGQAWHFGLKAHIGVDAQSGLVHSVQTTPASTHDATMLEALLHGEETALVADSAYGNMTLKAYCREAGLHYLITDKAARSVKLSGKQHRTNRKKSSVRGKVEFPFRIIKQLWGHTKVRYRGLLKNASQLHVLFALSNLFQARKQLLALA